MFGNDKDAQELEKLQEQAKFIRKYRFQKMKEKLMG